MVWATGRVVSTGSFHNLFFRLNWHSDSMGSNPIDAEINLFQREFISFCSCSRQVVEFSLFHANWWLWSMGIFICHHQNICWMDWKRSEGEFVDIVMCLIFSLTDMLVVHSECWVGSCRLTSIKCYCSFSHTVEEVSRLCLCVLLYVDIHVLGVWMYVVCVLFCVVCWFTHCVPLTHGVHTHICCKMTVQSIFMTLHFNTFLTLCCTTQIPVWLRDKYCPFKIYNVWLPCVDSTFKYKSSDVCVYVSHFMVVLLQSQLLTSTLHLIHNTLLIFSLCQDNAQCSFTMFLISWIL